MREIIFRGKRKDNGEWVYGDLLNVGVDYDYAIRTYGGREHGEVNAVNEKTVGQYTGLTDKNGKRIFEGDIVRETQKIFDDDTSYLVEWYEGSCGFEPFSDSKDNCGHCGGGLNPEWVEVIGNIHDNFELLK